MSKEKLLIICAESDQAHAWSLLTALLHDWPGGEVPEVELLNYSDLAKLQKAPVDAIAAWMLCDVGWNKVEVKFALDILTDWQMPTLLSRSDEEEATGSMPFEGVLIGPLNSGPTQLRPLFQGMWSQASTIARLKLEQAVADHQQRGVLVELDKIDEELRLSSLVQREFLPTELPQLGQVGFEVLFRPAGYVSGDIYDVNRLDEEHVGFYIADSVGHGVPAALMTVFIKHALPVKDVFEDGYRILSPNEALSRLNCQMLKHRPDSGQIRFATACYGVLNVKNYKLQIARAGHPAPILVRSNGSSETLEPQGPLLGVFDDDPFELLEKQLEPGDRLLIYSDGFEEAFKDEDYEADGRPRHIQALEQLGCGPANEAMQQLKCLLDDQPGSLHQSDDITALLMGIAVDEPSTPRTEQERISLTEPAEIG